MITPFPFLSHRSPVLAVPRAKAIAALDVSAREVAQALQSVDLALRLDLRDADPSNAKPADGEWVSMPPVSQGAVARIAVAEIGSLDLGHFHLGTIRIYAPVSFLAGLNRSVASRNSWPTYELDAIKML
jgi:hypothetical protein